uniref:Ig-like domain-containing protein n=1 Tax=Cyprinus carpio carpio TaxID=630221 RepID=A0A8C1H6U8_CYPCA
MAGILHQLNASVARAFLFFIRSLSAPPLLLHSVFSSHAFITTYTEINGHAIEGIPEISSVAALDGRQIDYYDSEIKMLIPRQDWMKEFISGDRFKEYTEIRERVQQTNKINITVLMQQFNQTHGVHTYQRMYGCEWDNETGYSRGFDQHGYDGQDFILLDMNEAQLELLRQYYQHELIFSSHLSQSFIAPEVSLLQKDPSSPVVCHVTSFYPSGVTITWLRNGQEHDEDVDLEELLPNEDGTFQRTSFLNIPPDEWEKNQFVCEVQHRGRTFRKILTADEIKRNFELRPLGVAMGNSIPTPPCRGECRPESWRTLSTNSTISMGVAPGTFRQLSVTIPLTAKGLSYIPNLIVRASARW